jgi:CDP-diacylglycerol--glycerol-3-phosphate 3-phosphatidyltransferase
MASWYKRIPNWLTILRLALIPVFVLMLNDESRSGLNAAAVIFIFAAITDYADGIIARRYSAVSDFGKLLDPLADKILVMAALVMLVSLHDERGLSFVPAWMVVVILAREFWITGLRALAASGGTVVAAKSGGKVKSFLQMVGIVALLLNDYAVTVSGVRLPFQYIGLNILLVSIVFSYLSAIDYSLAILAPGQKSLSELAKGFSGGARSDGVADAVAPESVPEASSAAEEAQANHTLTDIKD